MSTDITSDANGQGSIPGEPEATPGAYLEIVWSSPVFTQLKPAAGEPSPSFEETQKVQEPTQRYVFAFESDFLDSAMISWNEEAVEQEVESHPAESVTATSTLQLLDIYPSNPKPKLESTELLEVSSPGVLPVEVPAEALSSHNDWRPQGLVFFETLSLRPVPPRSVIYSSSEEVRPAVVRRRVVREPGVEQPVEAEQAVVESAALPELDDLPPPLHPTPEAFAVQEALKPFFDIPDHVAQVPGEDTAELYKQPAPAVRKGFVHAMLNAASWSILVLFFVGIGFGLLYGRYARNRLFYKSEGASRVVEVVVQPGETFRSVISNLQSERLLGSYMGISDWYLMRYLAQVNDNSNKIKPGAYRFESSMPLNDIYNRLIEGSQDYKITIPEGKSVEEVAAEVKKRYETFDSVRFLELTKDAAFIRSLKVDAPSLEGYLYPSTYFFGPGMKEEELVKLMVTTFQQNVESQMAQHPIPSGFSFHDLVIIASLIEREARMDEDRPLIASVIYNRLKQNMPLQIDATVNYVLNDWRKLSLDDLKVDSPYNTYQNRGLPPGPICSPRIASLLATVTAPETPYLYYVYQGNGRHAFSESYEEFLANKHRYQKGIAAAPDATPEDVATTEASRSGKQASAGTSGAKRKR